MSRFARIRQLKAASCNAFMNSKRRADLHQMTATEEGDADHLSVVDLFQMQHHHLLNCLEHTTVSLFSVPFLFFFFFLPSSSLFFLHSIDSQPSARFRVAVLSFRPANTCARRAFSVAGPLV